jgi:hypothetical protein
MARVSLSRAHVRARLRFPTLAATLLVLAASPACNVHLAGDASEGGATNTCERSADCAAGTCRFGACVAAEGALETLLLEIVPPASAPGIGGVRVLDIADGFSVSRNDLELNLPRVASLRGFLRAYDPEVQQACLQGAASTLPVRVTFTPRERSIGLSGGTYVATTTLSESRSSSHPCRDSYATGMREHDLSVNVPVGRYDIYVEPLELDDACAIAPALLEENLQIEAGNVCLKLAASRPEELRVLVEWRGAFEGVRSLDRWSVDLVHPITGQVLSTRGALSAASVTTTQNDVPAYEVRLWMSPLPGGQKRELVRLTPPEGAFAPVIQLERSALVAVTPGTSDALIGNLDPFPAPVQLEGWVWRDADFERGREVPVPATVLLTATRLDGIAPGIFASYATAAEVGADGRLVAAVLPGAYRARVVPTVGSGLSAFETVLEVPCTRLAAEPDRCALRESETPEVVQAGRVLRVPAAARVTGTVRSALGSEAVEGAMVTGVAGLTRARVCAADAGGVCAASPVGVLERALGEDRFAPRGVSALVIDGRFAIDEADCALCQQSEGAIFDFLVRPADGSGFSWGIRSGVVIQGDTELGSIAVPLPTVHRGRVQLPQADAPVPIGGALIRAYAFRLSDGSVTSDADLPACNAGELEPSSDCIRSVLQVAETRAAADGTFSLFVPASVE